MSQLNKQDAYLHWALTQPKKTYPFKSTCKSCKHWKEIYPSGNYTHPTDLCLLGREDDYKDYHTIGDYLESQGLNVEQEMAPHCPHYTNVIGQLRDSTIHREVFGWEDIPPLTAQNWSGHKKPEKVEVLIPAPLQLEKGHGPWPKELVALIVLIIGLLGGVAYGIIQEVNKPSQYSPQVETNR